jgi:hypothetical protein
LASFKETNSLSKPSSTLAIVLIGAKPVIVPCMVCVHNRCSFKTVGMIVWAGVCRHRGPFFSSPVPETTTTPRSTHRHIPHTLETLSILHLGISNGQMIVMRYPIHLFIQLIVPRLLMKKSRLRSDFKHT